MENGGDGNMPTMTDTLKDVGKLALPFALLGGILGAAYKIGTVLIHTPAQPKQTPKLEKFGRIRKSPVFAEIFQEMEPYCTINPKWEEPMMVKIDFLIQAYDTFETMVHLAENLLAKIDALGAAAASSGNEFTGQENAQEEFDPDEMISRANERFEAAVMSSSRKRKKSSAHLRPKTRRLLDAVQQMRNMVSDGNILMEEVIVVKKEISNMCNEFFAIQQCFNSYWQQCNQVLLSDPAVYLAKSVDRSTGALVMSNANVDIAADMIQKKSLFVEILYDDGRLPGDEHYDENLAPFIRWWIMMHCLILPTMHGIAYERGWKKFDKSVNASSEPGQAFRVSRKRKDTKSKEYTAIIERASSDSGYFEQCKFWFERVKGEGLNSVLREPWAGFNPGKKDLLSLPRVPLRTSAVKSLLGKILITVNRMVDGGMLINQWKVLKILDKVQSRLKFFETTGRVFNSPEDAADFFATDQLLVEQTLMVRDEWKDASVETGELSEK